MGVYPPFKKPKSQKKSGIPSEILQKIIQLFSVWKQPKKNMLGLETRHGLRFDSKTTPLKNQALQFGYIYQISQWFLSA